MMRPLSLAATLAATVLCAPALASTCFGNSGARPACAPAARCRPIARTRTGHQWTSWCRCGRDGRPAQLPRTAHNRYGYDLEFDDAGKLADLRIDFAAIAAHLAQLDLQARRHGFGIARVILEPACIPRVLATPAGQRIKSLPFMKTRPWVRHDEHYHVDFAVKCAR